jgi:hypothetical protein
MLCADMTSLGWMFPEVQQPNEVRKETMTEPATYEELAERNRMLSDIALSAIALKLNIEHGYEPTLHVLTRYLDAYTARFGGPLAKTDRGN